MNTLPSQQQNFNYKTLLAIIIGVIAGSVFLHYYRSSSSTPSIDAVMMKSASEINKTCPIMIDSETRLDNTIALPNHVFQYNYTLVNCDKASVDTAEMRKSLEPTAVNFIRTNPQMQYSRENEVTVNYYYSDKAGNYLLTISVTPEQYK